MISHRTRAIVAGVPIVLLATVLFSSPGLAVGTLAVSTPRAGSSISGITTVAGTVGGTEPAVITVGLAPQVLGDCGVVLFDTQVALRDAQFTTDLATTAVPDGDYCLIAMSSDGRLSTVVGDIIVANTLGSGETLDGLQLPTESLDGVQLPTESLDGDDAGLALESPVMSAADSTFATATTIGAIALGATAVLALLVLGLGLWARQPTRQ